MNHNSPLFGRSNGAAGNVAARPQRLQPGWHRLPAAARSPVWPGLLGALLIVGMLLAFHQVVHGAVQQGALRHKATAVHADATWRCNALPGQGASDNCLRQLNATVYGVTVAQAQTTLLARHNGISSPSQSR